MAKLRRREVLRDGLAAGGALVFGPVLARLGPAAEALAAPAAHKGPGPYGPLQASNLTGVQVPAGFTVREIARGGSPVGTTGYVWHIFSDASGSMPLPDGGWLFASNSEVPDPGDGGASVIRFDKDGNAQDAYRILSGTSTNCGGGITPWGTWLSGEEVDTGLVWEADLLGQKPAVARPALGTFSHEYAVVHEADRRVYETEDQSGGCFYRFTPAKWGDLSAGLLEVATLRPDGVVEWRPIPDPEAKSKPLREQVPAASKMARPEGLCVHKATGLVYFIESSAGRVFQYDPATETWEKIYAEADIKDPELTDCDNIAVSERSRDLFVCEDTGDLDISIITPDGEVAKFAHLDGAMHGDPSTEASSEMTGPSFDPSGTRLYFASQRAFVTGAVYEITGPFRTLSAAAPGPSPSPSEELRLRIHAYRRTLRSRVRREGLRVGVAPSETADVVAVLRAPVGAKGSNVTLASARRAALTGKAKLTLKPTSKGRSYLARRGKPVKATLVATATTTDSKRDVVERSIELR
jgi:secreted PhoX family phosphatase